MSLGVSSWRTRAVTSFKFRQPQLCVRRCGIRLTLMTAISPKPEKARRLLSEGTAVLDYEPDLGRAKGS